MNHNELENYIQKYRHFYSKEQITTHLLKYGVNKENIESIYKEMNLKTAPPSFMQKFYSHKNLIIISEIIFALIVIGLFVYVSFYIFPLK